MSMEKALALAALAKAGQGGGGGDVSFATDAEVKAGTAGDKALAPSNESAASFYGLAKAAGDNTQAASSNPVGTYTAEAKNAIKSMLGVDNYELIGEYELTEPVDSIDIVLPRKMQKLVIVTDTEFSGIIKSDGTDTSDNVDILVNGTSTEYYRTVRTGATTNSQYNRRWYLKLEDIGPCVTLASCVDSTSSGAKSLLFCTTVRVAELSNTITIKPKTEGNQIAGNVTFRVYGG